MYRRKRNSANWRFVLFAGIITIFTIALMAIVVIIIKPEQKSLPTTQCMVHDLSQKCLSNIDYEDTFLYQEEIKKQKEQEFRKLNDLKRKAEEEAERILKTIAKVIYAEAIGESMEGKIGVGATIVNRLQHPDFPDTLEEVLEGEYFEVSGVKDYADISWISNDMLTQECLDAAQAAIDGEDPFAEELGGPTLFFYNPEKVSDNQLEKREGIKVVKEGEHLFHHEGPKWD